MRLQSLTSFLCPITSVRVSALILSATLLGGLPSPAMADTDTKTDAKKEPKDWKFMLGAAGGYFVDYEGSDDYEIKPLPLFNVSWRDMISIGTIGGPGVKFNFLRIKGPTPKDRILLTTSLGYFGGRDQDDNDALLGLGDIDGGVTAKISADYQAKSFGVNVSAGRDLSGDREGTTLNATVRYSFALGSPQTRLTLSSSMTWADDNYMDNVFGISTTQAAQSRFSYSTHSAESGFKDVGLNVSVLHLLNQNVAITGQIGFKQLLGDASDSPIVDGQGNAGQFSSLVGVSYNW